MSESLCHSLSLPITLKAAQTLPGWRKTFIPAGAKLPVVAQNFVQSDSGLSGWLITHAPADVIDCPNSARRLKDRVDFAALLLPAAVP